MTYFRFVIAVAMVTSLLLFAQKEVAAVVQSDPTLYYERFNLLGIMDFQYEKRWTRYKTGNVHDSSEFIQNYFLGMRGNYLSTTFFIFDADAEFEKRDSKSSGLVGERETRLQQYSFEGTFFPKYFFPLTLSARRKVREGYGGESISHKYGLRWHIKHWRYPETKLRLGYSTTDAKNFDSRIFNYGVTFSKKILEMYNRLAFNGIRSEVDSVSGKSTRYGYDNFSYNSSVRHRFWNSKTRVRLRHAKTSIESNNTSSERNRTSLNMGISQQPLPRVSQSFGFGANFSESRTSESESNRYSYSLSYRPTKRLYLRQILRYRVKETDADDIDEAEEFWRSDSRVTYRHFTGINLNGSLYYFERTNEFVDVVTESKTEKGYGVSGGLSYGKGIKIWRFRLAAAYSISYKRWERVFPDGEKRTVEKFPQTFSLNVDFDYDKEKGLILKYVRLMGNYRFDAGYSGTRRYDQERLRDTSIDFDSDIDRDIEEDYEDYEESDTWAHLFSLKVDKYGNYWRRTKFGSKLTYIIQKGKVGSGTRYTTNVDGRVDHKRIIRIRNVMRGRLSGELTLGASVRAYKTESNYQDTESINVKYRAQYRVSPFRNTRVTLAIDRKETYTKISDRFVNTFETQIMYWLGAWRFELELEREIIEDTRFLGYTNDRIFLRATREFTRVF